MSAIRPRLALAWVLPLLACGLQALLWEDFIRPYAWVLFIPATFGSAWLGGWRGGLGATLLSAGLNWYFFISPAHSLALETRSAAFSVASFAVMGGLFSWFFDRLEHQQRGVQSRFDQTFDHAPVGMAELGADGRWQRLNDRFCEILGYSREELLRRGPQAFTHPDDVETDRALLARLLNGELERLTREKRFFRPDGSTGWLQVTVSAVNGRRARPRHLVAVIEDIGPRKAAEASLRLSEQHHRELVESANSAIIHWSADGRITFVNAFAQQLFGWSSEELIGQPVAMLVPPRESTGQDLSGLVQDIAAHPERYRSTFNENICRDGRRLWMSWTNSALRDAQGQVTSILAVGSDLTELREVRSALSRSEDRIRFVLDAARIGAWEIDLDSGAVQRSSLHDEVYGYPQRAPNWSFSDFIAHVLPDDREAVLAGYRQAIERRQPWITECRLRRPDGQIRWVWIAGMPIGEGDGGARRMSGIVQDITDRKRAEIQLQRQTEELRRRNDELERFNRASVGRELRTVELKQQVNQLCRRLGEPEPFDVGFASPPAVGDEGASA